MNNINSILFKQGLNQQMLAEMLDIRSEYVSMYNTGKGDLPRYAWQKIHEYFMEVTL